MGAEELYSILKSNGRRSYDTDWLKANTGMSPDELNQAADVLQRQGKVKLHKEIGGSLPYKFTHIEVLDFE